MPTLDSRPELTAPTAADLIHIQDVSDTTDSAAGTSKKCTLESLRAGLGLVQTHAENVFGADQTMEHSKALVFSGHVDNAPWRVFTSSSAEQPTDQIMYFVYNGYYDPVTGWAERDADNVAVIRHGFESLWDGMLEWNLDVAPAGTGVPIFRERLYGMFYSYEADSALWVWRSTPTGTMGAGADMQLTSEALKVGSEFSVELSTGKITVSPVDPSPKRALILGGNGGMQARIDLQGGRAAVPSAAIDLRDGNNSERGRFFYAGQDAEFLADASEGDVGVSVMGGRFVVGVDEFADSAPAIQLLLDSSGNLGLGTTDFGRDASHVLAIGSGSAPVSAVADTIQLYVADLTDGNTILGLRTEGSDVVGEGRPVADRTIAIEVNGTVYYLLAATATT